MSGLPEGFVVDSEMAKGGGLPEGFVIDAPKKGVAETVASSPIVQGQQEAGAMLDTAIKRHLPDYKPSEYQPTFIPTPGGTGLGAMLGPKAVTSAVPQLAKAGPIQGLNPVDQALLSRLSGSAPGVMSETAQTAPGLLSRGISAAGGVAKDVLKNKFTQFLGAEELLRYMLGRGN